METAAARAEHSLKVSIELSLERWKVLSAVHGGGKQREKSMPAGDLVALHEELVRARQKHGLPAGAAVYSCYEAGRDGHWLHRHLVAMGVENVVVDPASLPRSGRHRRAKTDRLDGRVLLGCLIRYLEGERGVWSVVRVPSVEEEDQRHLHRELEVLKRERGSHRNRLRGLLVLHGVRLEPGREFLARLAAARQWDGSPLPPELVARAEREYARLRQVEEQIDALVHRCRQLLRESQEPAVAMVRRLMRLKSLGEASAWVLVFEFFAWRQFRNRRQVGKLAGMTGTPRQSGEMDRDAGLDKSGNPRVRRMMVELAWCWLRWQPQSRLSLWFHERFGRGGKRSRKVGIVALGRKLLVALWRYLEQGIVPEGAVLKAA